MPFIDDFKNTLLPGNYALTKSMELTKVTSSGTLWYTKKFLTLYFYVFLSNDILTHAYVDKVTEEFDRYIEGLDDTVKEAAKLYFYPDNPAINFKSQNFNTFSAFASYNNFATPAERTVYYQKAKKYYFSLLMGSGGQTGIKRKLKEAVQRPGFIYSGESIADAIQDSAVSVCVEEANRYHEIRDNSVKYILSQDAITEIETEASANTVTLQFVQDAVARNPNDNPRYGSIENDMVAFIRNERQILYYYGYFHSKSSGANDFEFSSLTPIGELALTANANEFLAIWEHQKVKMISQPATADINNLPATEQGDFFSISYKPYTDILGHLKRRATLTFDEYQYIVSRKRHGFSNEEWESAEDEMCANIHEIKQTVESFGRARDIATEDCQKELKKYLLGIRADLPADKGTNAFNSCTLGNNSTVEVTNADEITTLYNIYSKLDEYKIHRYQEVFEECETDLRRRYKATCAGENLSVDPRVKIHWDLYNIHADKLILMGTMFAIIAAKMRITNIEAIGATQMQAITEAYGQYFAELLRDLGVNTHAKIKREVRTFVTALRNSDYTAYIPVNDDEHEQVIARYREVATDDLRVRIEDVSAAAVVSQTAARERNGNLISMLKSYYIQRFAQDNELTCECCGEKTFITEAGEPYVEFHHMIPFNIAYGPDHYLNLYALCPNCHRKIHFMNLEIKGDQYKQLDEHNYLRLELTERLRQLKAQNLLRSYHLEYLLADKAITLEEYNSIAA